MSEKRATTIRVDAKLKEQLRKVAQDQERTVAGTVIRLIQECVKNAQVE